MKTRSGKEKGKKKKIAGTREGEEGNINRKKKMTELKVWRKTN